MYQSKAFLVFNSSVISTGTNYVCRALCINTMLDEYLQFFNAGDLWVLDETVCQLNGYCESDYD